jgi:hypothetical protein
MQGYDIYIVLFFSAGADGLAGEGLSLQAEGHEQVDKILTAGIPDTYE